MSRMYYVSPHGTIIDLVSPGDWDRRVAYGGVSGLVGKKVASTVSTVSSPGQALTGFTVGPMDGVLTLTLAESARGKSIDSLHAELVREFLPDTSGTLVLERDAFLKLMAKVRLNGVIDFPQSFLGSGDSEADVKIPLVADRGLWVTQMVSASGDVTVTNSGDYFVWPEILWVGSPAVVLPSGATIQLPDATSERRLSLNPETSHEVVGANGLVDEALSDVTAQLMLGEGIPEGSSRTYSLGDGARLEWSLSYLNAWR